MNKSRYVQASALLIISALLSACDSDSDEVTTPTMPEPEKITYSYKIEVLNLTNSQPMSPILLSLNDGNFKPWTLGESASQALEKLAEGGDNSGLLLASQAENSGNYISQSATEPLGAGASDNWTLTYEHNVVQAVNKMPSVNLSLATMLVNTNDAITGIASWSLDSLDVGKTMTMTKAALDAGTEFNSELSGTIPGPADGGEGYNIARDDVDFVHIHPGVVSNDDTLINSVLSSAYKFDNPVIQIKVTRLQ